MAVKPVSLSLTSGFEDAYKKFGKYPLSLVAEREYGRAFLRQLQKVFFNRQPTLCVPDSETKFSVREISIDGRASKQNIFDESELRALLGDTTSPDPLNPANLVGQLATKPDPRCRFIFLRTISQTAPLQIGAAFLSRILTWHQVMPGFLDFLYVFGSPFGEDRELRYSGFRTEKTLVNPNAGNILPSLNRSGRRYQMCYNIKAVALKETDEKGIIDKSWKIRQAVIHHQFDLGDQGGQLWIMGDPHGTLKDMIERDYPAAENHRDRFQVMDQAFNSSLDVHLLYCRWSTQGWRAHIRSLEEIVDKLTSDVLDIGDKDSKKIRLESGLVGKVQLYEDLTNDAVMALESNARIMESMQEFYSELVQDEDFPQPLHGQCARHVRKYTSQMRELIYDTRMHSARASVLLKVVGDRKTVLIQHLQAQAAARQEQLAATMWRQAERSENEAIAMRIITVITLIYLPPTFSSTFFSTDIVKYQNNGNENESGPGGDVESRSSLALYRWLQVSLPLMALTFAIAIGWFIYERIKRQRRTEMLRREHPEVFAALKRGNDSK